MTQRLNDKLIRYNDLNRVYYGILEGGRAMIGFNQLNVQPFLNSIRDELKELYEEFKVEFPEDKQS